MNRRIEILQTSAFDPLATLPCVLLYQKLFWIATKGACPVPKGFGTYDVFLPHVLPMPPQYSVPLLQALLFQNRKKLEIYPRIRYTFFQYGLSSMEMSSLTTPITTVPVKEEPQRRPENSSSSTRMISTTSYWGIPPTPSLFPTWGDPAMESAAFPWKPPDTPKNHKEETHQGDLQIAYREGVMERNASRIIYL